MVAQGRGGSRTPERVVQLLNEAVSGSSQSAVSRATGLTQSAIGRYIKGIGEPSQATLEKLAVYFGVKVEYLRGIMWPENYGMVGEMLSTFEVLFVAALESVNEYTPETASLMITQANKFLNLSSEARAICNSNHYEEVKKLAIQVIDKFSTPIP